MKIDTSKTVFVFDLDDTLYQEATYLSSGVNHIKNLIKQLYEVDVSENIKSLNLNNDDFIGILCEKLKLSKDVKQSFIWEYRLHSPKINLNSGVRNLINSLENLCHQVTILTDGRSITQRKKLLALGLNHLPVFISEEYSETKLDFARFKKIEKNYPTDCFIYIGDNPSKDFIVPNQLGWITIGVTANSNNIHVQDLSLLDKKFHPHFWIDQLKDLENYLC